MKKTKARRVVQTVLLEFKVEENNRRKQTTKSGKTAVLKRKRITQA